MDDFEKYLQGQLKDDAFKSEYDALEPAYIIAQSMLDARKETGMTQKQLAEKSGIAQADISKLENGNGNPSVRTLQRLAEAMGMRLEICFEPKQTVSSDNIPAPVGNIIYLTDFTGHSGNISSVTSIWRSKTIEELKEE